MRNIYWFDELAKDDIPKVGGKGANLGEMTQAGIPVPNGFCLSVKVYFDFIKANHIDELIERELTGLNPEDNRALQDASKIIKKAIVAKNLSKSQEKEITNAYKKLGKDIYVAVRSSATAEDLPSIGADEHVFVKLGKDIIYDKMKNLYRQIEQGLINPVNLEVVSMKSNRLVWRRVSDIYKHKIKKKEKLYEIITNTGRKITISPNHTLIVQNKENLKPKTISILELNIDDRIPCLRMWPKVVKKISSLDVLKYIEPEKVILEKGKIYVKNNSTNCKIQNPLPRRIKINNDFLYFLGVYCAEGSTYKNNSIIITNSNERVQKRTKRFLSSLNLYQKQKMNKHSIRIYCKTLVLLLHKLIGEPQNVSGKGKSCRIKRVPNFIFSLDDVLIGEFLKGLFDGDGSVLKNIIEYTSVSEMLAGGVIKLLEKINLKFYIRRKNDAFHIAIPLSESEKFDQLIGFEDKRKLERIRELVMKYKNRSRYQQLKESFDIPFGFAQKIRKEVLSLLSKKTIKKYYCKNCGVNVEKTSYYKERLRFYCRKCGKAYYLDGVRIKKIKESINYNQKGQFTKEFTPWNKGLVTGRFTPRKWQKAMNRLRLRKFVNLFSDYILWDKVKEIKPVKSKGYVYDFCVPGIENFAAGMGGIITHNSASFAGQQATFLNVKGDKNLILAVKKCFASLFEPRAIYYRIINKFEHLKVGLAVPIQKMVEADAAGVMFTIDPVSNNKELITIDAAYGLGEIVVSGAVSPDHYVVDKDNLEVKEKKIIKQTWAIKKFGKTNKRVKIKYVDQEKQKITDKEIVGLAKIGKVIEEHYQFPQDIEWAVKDGKIYMLQSRPVTTIKTKARAKGKIKKGHRVILKGAAASVGQAAGSVKIVTSPKELDKIQKSDVLVAKMTNPSYVPAMKRASAIITDQGGQTSHAAIVSRELAIPCVVGTSEATKILQDGDLVTVDGEAGLVYEGDVVVDEMSKTKIKMSKIKTKTKIYVNLAEVEAAERIAKLPVDGVGLLRAEFMIAEIGEHPRAMLDAGRGNIFINKLAKGLETFVDAFNPRPVIYRATDFKTNEYKNLKGGDKYEHDEPNPMIGYRGAMRYIQEPDLFELEIKAMKKVRKKYKNLHLMIPFVRTLDEMKKVIALLEKFGLPRAKDFKLYVMCEVPSTVILAQEFIDLGIDGFSIGSNDLTQLTLGLDRDNERVAGEFDERDPAVMQSMKKVIEICKKNKVACSICGQAPSVYPEVTEALVKWGMTSVSVNPDVIIKTRELVAEVEKKLKE